MAGKRKPLDTDYIISLYKSFISIQDIASQIGVNHKTIRSILHRVGTPYP
jgi:Mn-dependent DtxR family transcriptional regulator